MAEKNESEGVPELDKLDEARATLKQIQEQNKILAENIRKAEKLAVERVLSGNASAGHREQTEEEKEIESAKSLLAGTGLEDYAFPPIEAERKP